MIDSEKDNRPAELATNKKNNLLPNDSDDIIRHAMIKIKADQCGASKQSKRKYKNPCSVSSKNYLDNQQVIQCTQCDNQVHRKCNGISKEEFAILVAEDDDIPFYCVVCTIHNNAHIFPFGY